MKRLSWVLVAAVLLVLVSGCAGPNPLVGTPGRSGVAGFWAGLWHGMICVISFVISLFNKNVHVYEVHNRGALYDLGFLFGASAALGGLGRSTRR